MMFRDKVNIYRYTTTSDGAGGVIESKTLYRGDTWANVSETLSSVQLENGEWIKARAFECRLRYREDLPIATNDVLEFKGLNMVVKSATLYNKDRNRFQLLTFRSNE